MPTREDTRRWLAALEDERNSGALYAGMAAAEKNPKLAAVYRHLADTEKKHAGIFAQKLRDAGVHVPSFRPSARTRILGWLAARFGVEIILPSLAATEDGAASMYTKHDDMAAMAPEERSHALFFRQVGRTSRGGGMEGSALAQLEGRHRSAGGNALRAAVLGANDGLVSNLSLVMGVAGANLSGHAILVTGLAGLLAGATSMALGEWISVQSSRELYQKQIETEREEIEQMPDEEIEELKLIYQARGLEEQEARRIAVQIMGNKATALDALVRDELGVDPDQLGGSAWEAAITSFLLFALGAALPVSPFFALQGMAAVGVSLGVSSVGLFALGAAITLFTGKPVLHSGLRMVLVSLAAAAVTFLVGHLIGIQLAP
jgi:VIT1/CCC1 family predicted Fe2+/Mn2+ transporter